MPSHYVVTSEEMASLDKATQAHLKIPENILMEDAGLKAWLLLKKKIQSLFSHPLVFFIGPGNNGGDGLVIARQALLENHTKVYLVLLKESKTSANQMNLAIVKKLKGNFFSFPVDNLAITKLITPQTVIVDGLFGVGFRKTNDKKITTIINWINRLKKKYKHLQVVALDLPSGLGYGCSPQKIVGADLTITFGPYKDLFFYPEYSAKVGKIYSLNPGFPAWLMKKLQHKFFSYNHFFNVKKLQKNDFKNSRGSVLILGGSRKYLGAPNLAGLASFKAGAGLVSLIVREKDYPLQTKKNNNFILEKVKLFDFNFAKQQTLLIGPGLGRNLKDEEINFFFSRLVNKKNYDALNCLKSLVFDADGLIWFKHYQSFFSQIATKLPIILTPHLGEMAMLLGKATSTIKKNPYFFGKELSKKWGVFIILKLSTTYIFTPQGKIATIHYPNPSLGVAGSGDILGGIISSIITYQLSVFSDEIVLDYLALAVLIHSLSGKIAHKKLGFYSAEELVNVIPLSLNYFLNKEK